MDWKKLKTLSMVIETFCMATLLPYMKEKIIVAYCHAVVRCLVEAQSGLDRLQTLHRILCPHSQDMFENSHLNFIILWREVW